MTDSEETPKEPTDLEVRAAMSRRVAGTPPAIDKLVQHAERYGVDGIAETGAESGLDEEALTALIVRLDAINEAFRRDPKRKALHFSPPKTLPADAGRRARLLLGIPEPDPLTKTSPGAAAPEGKIPRPKKEDARGGTGRGAGARAGKQGEARGGRRRSG